MAKIWPTAPETISSADVVRSVQDSSWRWSPLRCREDPDLDGDRYQEVTSSPVERWRAACLGASRAAGGICAMVRDLAVVGQLFANAGIRGGNQVLPRVWLDDMAAGGEPQAWSAGDFAAYILGARYRSK